MSKLHPESFPVSTDDCELLIAFSQTTNLTELAAMRGRDVSVVSRQLQKLSAKMPLLEKDTGKWKLSELGKQLVQWSREAIQSQHLLLDAQSRVSIATTQEFAARILANGMPALLEAWGGPFPSVHAFENGIEAALLSGECDIGFDCGRPQSPSIKFHMVRREPLALVASPAFLKKHKAKSCADCLSLPYVEFPRVAAARALGLTQELSRPVAQFNTVAGARSAVVAGLGWTVLPIYTVKDEIEAKRLEALPVKKILEEQFGVWWLRGNRGAEKLAKAAVDWLKEQDLG